MKDTFYFTHDYNARSDRKLIAVMMKHGVSGIGCFWCIVEMLYEEGGYISCDEYERIAFELRTSENVIREVIEKFDLFQITDGFFFSESIIERLKSRTEKSEKARKSVEARWDSHRKKSEHIRTQYERNTIKESKEQETKEKKENNIPQSSEEKYLVTRKKKRLIGKRLETFEIFWDKFNYKKGRAEAADAWLEIPELNKLTCELIYKSAEQEAKCRLDLIASGKTPKMAQGWITARRWEDEIYPEQPKKQINNQPTPPPLPKI